MGFKKGDRVQAVEEAYRLKPGDTGTVIGRDGTGDDLPLWTVRLDNGKQEEWFASRFELVEPLADGEKELLDAHDPGDPVHHPQHYKFSNGAEVIDISENLTANAAQVVQYVSRSSRLDGKNKGNVLEDLQKAQWFLQREIERVGA